MWHKQEQRKKLMSTKLIIIIIKSVLRGNLTIVLCTANLAPCPLQGAATWRIKWHNPRAVYYESFMMTAATILHNFANKKTKLRTLLATEATKNNISFALMHDAYKTSLISSFYCFYFFICTLIIDSTKVLCPENMFLKKYRKDTKKLCPIP